MPGDGVTSPALLAVSVIRGVTEVAMLALLGQGVLALLAGSRRAANPVYQLFQIVTSPVLRTAGRMLPKRLIGKRLPFVAFFLLFWLWILLAYVKRII